MADPYTLLPSSGSTSRTTSYNNPKKLRASRGIHCALEKANWVRSSPVELQRSCLAQVPAGVGDKGVAKRVPLGSECARPKKAWTFNLSTTRTPSDP